MLVISVGRPRDGRQYAMRHDLAIEGEGAAITAAMAGDPRGWMMRRHGLLGRAVLSISRHLLERRMAYYDMLRSPRRRGGWARWLAFFADACAAQARAGVEAMVRADGLRLEHRGRAARLGLGEAGLA